MTKRRLLSVLLFGGVMLAAGVVPAGAAPGSAPMPNTATLAGPRSLPCNGGPGTVPVGTATIQSATGAVPPDQRALRVSVAADKVRARTTYDVYLAATVVEGGASGCRLWPAGTTSTSANGKLAFSGVAIVPLTSTLFQVFVAQVATVAEVSYVSGAIDTSNL